MALEKAKRRKKVKILMLSAGVITGAFQRMAEIIKYIDSNQFKIYVTYKPDYAQWGKTEIDTLIEFGAKIVPLRGRLLFDLRGFIDIWHILKKEKIDILHCWDVLGVPGRMIGKFSGVRIVQGLGNPPPVIISEISLKHYLINKITSILVDGYIACSKGIMERYLKQKPEYLENKVRYVVHNCVDISNFKKEQSDIYYLYKKYGLRNNEAILTNIGYFNEQKGQFDLLEAFKKVTDRRSDVRLFLIGWGHLEDGLKRKTEALGLKGRVIFTGKLLRTDVLKILAITDLFVLSSLWEGFGRATAEAMALGKPVVSTYTDGSKEVVEDGKTGILVPIKNPTVLADAILDILENPDLMAKMGEEGHKRVIKHFSCEKFIEGYENFYKNVLSSNYKTHIDIIKK